MLIPEKQTMNGWFARDSRLGAEANLVRIFRMYFVLRLSRIFIRYL